MSSPGTLNGLMIDEPWFRVYIIVIRGFTSLIAANVFTAYQRRLQKYTRMM